MTKSDIILAPGMAAVLAEEARLSTLTPAEAAAFWAVGADEVLSTEDVIYPGGAGQEQRVRLYRATEATAPCLLYVHGGGWCGGSIELHDSSARALCARSGCHVASISYRLSPDHPFPAGLEDTIAACRWLKAAPPQGVDPARIAVGGASAGANLALAAALSLPRDAFAALILFYGVYDCDFDAESYGIHDQDPSLSRSRMKELFQLYTTPDRYADPLVSPLRGDLSGLPPVLNAAAGIDVLRTENERLADRLAAEGTTLEAWTEPGVAHGFINRGRLLPSAHDVLDRAAAFLARHTNAGTS